jgi:hypothetical protein
MLLPFQDTPHFFQSVPTISATNNLQIELWAAHAKFMFCNDYESLQNFYLFVYPHFENQTFLKDYYMLLLLASLD